MLFSYGAAQYSPFLAGQSGEIQRGNRVLRWKIEAVFGTVAAPERNQSVGSNRVKKLPYIVITITLLLLSAGCGFQMRGAWTLPQVLSQTQISGSFSSQLYTNLQRNFTAASASLSSSKGASTATLRVYKDYINRRVLSVSERGKAAEYELYYIVEFDVTDAKGKVIVARQGLNLTRDYLYEVSSVISTDRQDRLLRVNLQKDMADLMMRRIQAQAK